LIAGSLPKVSAAAAGIALLLQPARSFIWDILFFARDITPQELIGAVIVLGAIYLGSR
jgi:drug/metabolite transporter (DMT)-like permease